LKNLNIKRTAAAILLAGCGIASVAPASNAADLATWEKLAQCESGGNWSINTGNGFYGGIQFTQESWNGVGMTGSPHTASKETQIEAAERLLAIQGWGAWPACSAKYGLSGAATPTYTNPAEKATVTSAPATQTVAPQSAQGQNVYVAPVATTATVEPATAPVAQAEPVGEAPVVQEPVVQSPVTTEPAIEQVTPVAPRAASTTYQVVPGDTLSLIAQRLGVPGGYKAIADANVDVIYDVNLIFPGQVLTIPQG
jgi:transglycosylase family protein